MIPRRVTGSSRRNTRNIQPPQYIGRYQVIGEVGSGTFGNVYAVALPDGRRLALKKVLQNPRYKNREGDIIKMINHPNCLHLYDSGLIQENNEVYLYLLTDLFSNDLHHYLHQNNQIPLSLIKIFGYQLFNGLDYIHSLGITHRDIKSSNVLVDPVNGRLEICDFGSAKMLRPNEESLFYISTRMYRAPELLYESKFYNSEVDVWAAGCVVAEMCNGGHEIFRSESNDKLMLNIAKSLGIPTEQDYIDMKAAKKARRSVRGQGLRDLFENGIDPLLLDLLEKVFVYSPIKRLTAAEAKMHPFFEGVAEGRVALPNGTLFTMAV